MFFCFFFFLETFDFLCLLLVVVVVVNFRFLVPFTKALARSITLAVGEIIFTNKSVVDFGPVPLTTYSPWRLPLASDVSKHLNLAPTELILPLCYEMKCTSQRRALK